MKVCRGICGPPLKEELVSVPGPKTNVCLSVGGGTSTNLLGLAVGLGSPASVDGGPRGGVALLDALPRAIEGRAPPLTGPLTGGRGMPTVDVLPAISLKKQPH